MNYKYYIAYGSNMNLEQMKYRCPNSEVIEGLYLENYELQFKGSKTGAYATIEPKENSTVPVLLWKLHPKDELTLDAYEGCPSFYRKENLAVNYNEIDVNFLTYIMNSNTFGVPTKDYVNVIAEGYKSAGFDTNILYDYLEQSNKNVMDEEKIQLNNHLNFNDNMKL